MLIFFIFTPFFLFFFLFFFGYSINKKNIFFIYIYLMFFQLLVLGYLFYSCIFNHKIFFTKLWTWFIFSSGSSIDITILVDSLSFFMLLLVFIVSSIVHIYSFYYMENDPHLNTFLSYLSLFTFFMFLLIVSTNFVQFFLGWEGIGLCSFLLISFWTSRVEAKKAALKAVFVNKVGDCALLFSFGLIFWSTKSLNFYTVFSLVPFVSNIYIFTVWNITFSLNDLIAFCFILAMMAKSAQIGLHIWLADAMEGPTPVSALIHAATMVTAGVFLLIRCSIFFEYSTSALLLLMYIGAFTAFFSGTVGIFQNDIKKIIAYSTCSQLGYMVMACGFSAYNAAFFHLITHGFFKALLFLSAGIVIHYCKDEQDIRKMGGLRGLMPITYSFFLIGSFSLIGFPFLAGFFSKDYILENAVVNGSGSSLIIYNLALLGIIFTTFYSYKIIHYVFLAGPNGYRHIYSQKIKEEAPAYVLWSLCILSILSIISGFLFKDLFSGAGNNFLNNAILTNFSYNSVYQANFEYFVFYSKKIPLFFIFSGFFSFYLTNYFWRLFLNFFLASKSYFYFYDYPLRVILICWSFFTNNWFINFIILKFTNSCLRFFRFAFLIEKTLLELFGPYGILCLLTTCSKNLEWVHLERNYNQYLNMFLIFSVFFNFVFLIN